GLHDAADRRVEVVERVERRRDQRRVVDRVHPVQRAVALVQRVDDAVPLPNLVVTRYRALSLPAVSWYLVATWSRGELPCEADRVREAAALRDHAEASVGRVGRGRAVGERPRVRG